MPIIERCWIKIGIVRPHNRSNFFIKPHLVKKIKVAQWAIIKTIQNRLEINNTLSPIIKDKPQRIWLYNLNINNIYQNVFHMPS